MNMSYPGHLFHFFGGGSYSSVEDAVGVFQAPPTELKDKMFGDIFSDIFPDIYFQTYFQIHTHLLNTNLL